MFKYLKDHCPPSPIMLNVPMTLVGDYVCLTLLVSKAIGWVGGPLHFSVSPILWNLGILDSGTSGLGLDNKKTICVASSL